MDPKPRPNHARYLEVLRAMSPEQRLRKAAELSEATKALAMAGLRSRYPHLTEQELRRRMVEMRCQWESQATPAQRRDR